MGRDVLADPLTDPLEGGGGVEGGLGMSGERTIQIADAQDVVERSNKKARDGGDPFWTGVNGTSDRLSMPDGVAKPSQWTRGVILVDEVQPDGTVVQVPKMVGSGAKGVTHELNEHDEKVYTDGDAGMAADLGLSGMDDYRERLKADFDFGGVISKYLELGDGAKQAFLDDMLDKYATDTEPGDAKHDTILALSTELWSYATTGADSTGKTDIGEMQGILYAIDAEIVKTSDSNTNMSEGTFTLPGTDIQIQRGDGVHGRATTLTTRHLLGMVEGGNDELEGYDDNLVFVDISGSMKEEMVQLGALMDAGNLEGDVRILTFHDNGSSLQYVAPPKDGTTKAERAKHKSLYETMKETQLASDDALAAYRANAGDADLKAAFKEARAAAIAARKAFTAYDQEINVRSPDEAASVLAAAGEGSTDTDGAFSMFNSVAGDGVDALKNMPMKESGLAAAHVHLSNLPDPVEAPTRPFKRQLLIMTDETDARPDLLADVKALADKHGYTMRILFSEQQGGEAKTFRIINVDDVDLGKLKSDLNYNAKHMAAQKSRGYDPHTSPRHGSYVLNRQQNGHNVLDWATVADAQGAEQKSWEDYTVR
jgi:hypothetical protein